MLNKCYWAYFGTDFVNCAKDSKNYGHEKV